LPINSCSKSKQNANYPRKCRAAIKIIFHLYIRRKKTGKKS
jgi:hypothetical protein